MKKNKLNVLPPENSDPWMTFFEESPLFMSILKNGKVILYSIAFTILAIILFYRLFNYASSHSEADFIAIEQNFKELSNLDSGTQKEPLKKFEKQLKSHPELLPKYEAALGQLLLVQNEITKATPLLQASIKRTSLENDPFYSAYAATSILVAESKFKEAFNKTKELKEKMDLEGQEKGKNSTFGTLLYAYNLLRQALLAQELQLKNEELASWNLWEDLSNTARSKKSPAYIDSDQFLSLERLLGNNQSGLTSYIEARKNILNIVK